MHSPPRILVVDDSETNRDILVMLLGSLVASRRPDAPSEVAGQAPASGGRPGIERPSVARPAPKPDLAENVAVLTRAINAVWGPTTLPTEPGSPLPAGS